MLCKNDLEDNISKYIQERVPKAELRTVFDVGANVGWFTWQTGNTFLDARFHLFEPVSAQFVQIPHTFQYSPKSRLLERCTLNQLAVGDEPGEVQITALPDVTVNRVLVEGGPPAPESWPVETVKIVRGDEYCAEKGIEHIDYLKIDAEGYDLRALNGFGRMLDERRVDFVQVEASLSHENSEHIHIDVFSAELAKYGFRLFRIINQASGQLPFLTRADVVYISDEAVHRFA